MGGTQSWEEHRDGWDMRWEGGAEVEGQKWSVQSADGERRLSGFLTLLYCAYQTVSSPFHIEAPVSRFHCLRQFGNYFCQFL